MKFNFATKQFPLTHIGYILPLIAILFVAIVAGYSFHQLPDYNWSSKQLWWGIPAFFLYPVSLSIMLFSWSQIMQGVDLTINRASNLYLYCISFVTRRLPIGLLWSVGSRIALYSKIGVKAKTLSTGMFWEFLLHSVSAFLVWFVFELMGYGFVKQLSQTISVSHIGVMGGLFAGGGALLYMYVRHSRKQGQTDDGLKLNFFLIGKITILYALTWMNASIMLGLVSRIIMNVPVTMGKLIAIWSFVGGIGNLLSIFPFLNLGAKEISLTLLLSQFTSLPQATLIALAFRLLLTVSDAIWPMSFALSLHSFVKQDIRQGRES